MSYLMKTTTFFFLRILTTQTIGTPKLRIVLEEEIDNTGNHIMVRLMNLMVYADLRLPGYLNRMERMTKEVIDERYYLELVYLKLLHLHSFLPLRHPERLHVEKILADIILKREGKSPRQKAKILGRLRGR